METWTIANKGVEKNILDRRQEKEKDREEKEDMERQIERRSIGWRNM